MPVLETLTGIYTKNPGVVDNTTLRGVIKRVIPCRAREYRPGTVLTLFLADLPSQSQSSNTGAITNVNASNSVSKSTSKAAAAAVIEEVKEGGAPTAAAEELPQRSPSKAGEHLTRVLLFDAWATALGFANAGDVLEIRTQFSHFMNPDSDGSPAFQSQTERIITATDNSEISVYSKEEAGGDILELYVNPDNLKGGEPLCRVDKNNLVW